MKILVDLNLQKKITMIMVTHDVSLKTFANRVVRMADGKIAKIEEIHKEQRHEAIRHLTERVDAIHRGVSEGLLQIRAGTEEQDEDASKKGKERTQVTIPTNITMLQNVTTTKTSVRRPGDYPVLRERFNK